MKKLACLLFSMAPAIGACSGGAAVTGGPFTGDPANATYELDGKSVTLKNGAFEERTGSGVDDFIATDLTGARLDADFDGDATTDCAVVVTRDDGPLKVHYLAVMRGGSTDTQSIALGKNVLVKSIDLDPKGGLVVKLLTHPKDAPVDEEPTVETLKHFAVTNGKLAPR